MRAMWDATWRAAAYCWHPLALLWALLPLTVAAGSMAGMRWFGWDPAVAELQSAMSEPDLLAALFDTFDAWGLPDLRPLLAPWLLIALMLPAVGMGTLLLVAWLMAPAMADLVVRRRFPDLQRSPQAAGRWAALGWSLACAVAALLALAVSVPLWVVPPLVLVLPPFIWGWLCHRVLAFDALSRHAGTAERRFILHHHRWPLRMAGLVCGLLAALPSMAWAAGAFVLSMAPWLMPLLAWAYTVVFAFASLWFAHYTLSALHRLRQSAAVLSYVHESRFAT